MNTTRFALGSLAAVLGAGVSVVDLGPRHPCNAGLVIVEVIHSAGLITSLKVRPGLLHRGAEMLFEVRDYRQVLSLANRHDWQAPIFGELLIAELVEKSLGIEVPTRAAWLRMLLAEHFRIASHAAYLSFVEATLTGDDRQTAALRESLARQCEALTGNRVHPMVVRLGGLGADPSTSWLAAERALLSEINRCADRLDALLAGPAANPWRSIAIVDDAAIGAFGLTGPAALASGIELDLRRSDPSYQRLDAELALQGEWSGDAHSRFAVLLGQLRQSVQLIAACLDGLPGGPVDQRLPKVIKVPEGDHYHAVEAPWGHAGALLVSRGDKTPWRLKLRTPTFNQVAAWEQVMIGCPVAALPAAIASLPYVVGDLDK